jgi:hypothetical protein
VDERTEFFERILKLHEDGFSFSEIATRLDVHRTTVSRNLDKAKVWQKENGLPETNTILVEGNETEKTISVRGRIRTLDDLLIAAGVSRQDGWKVEKWQANKWDSQTRDGDIIELWQVKAWLQKLPEWLLKPVQAVAPIRRQPSRSTEVGVEHCLVIPDSQNGYIREEDGSFTPLHDRRCWDIAVTIAEKMQPSVIVLLGDMLDLAAWGSYSTSVAHYGTTMPALQELHYWLACLRQSCPTSHILYIEGNHEFRIQRQIQDSLKEAGTVRPVNSDTKDNALSVSRLLDLPSLDIEYFGPYKEEFWLWDKVRIHHGDIARSGSGATTSAIIRDACYSEVVGHVHRLEMNAKAIAGPGGQKEIIYAMTPGTMCRLDQPVVPGQTKRTNWQNGLGVISKLPPTAQDHASISMKLIPITHGRAIYRGEVIRGESRIAEIREATGFERF